jgi:hypothetical protein
LLTLNEIIIDLATAITSNRTSLDDAVRSVESWVEHNASAVTEEDREHLGAMLRSTRMALTEESHSNATWLVTSTLRVHALRVVCRFHEGSNEKNGEEGAGARFRQALRVTESALREARADMAIAEMYRSLERSQSGARWLHEALTRLETVVPRDPIKLAALIPALELPRLSVLREALYRVRGLSQDEIARCRARVVTARAELQRRELVDMVQLLAASFAAVGDKPAARRALAILSELG